MVSEIQLLANRENGKLGGVKTVAGKQAIRYNAVTHGLLTKAAVIKGEDPTLLERLRDNLMAEKEPADEIETMLVELIATSYWRLRRAVKAESDNLNVVTIRRKDDLNYSLPVGAWDNLNRYETMIARQLYKTIHELERLQRLRCGENVPPPLAVDVDLPQQK